MLCGRQLFHLLPPLREESGAFLPDERCQFIEVIDGFIMWFGGGFIKARPASSSAICRSRRKAMDKEALDLRPSTFALLRRDRTHQQTLHPQRKSIKAPMNSSCPASLDTLKISVPPAVKLDDPDVIAQEIVEYLQAALAQVETRSLPTLTHCFPRSFTFYVAVSQLAPFSGSVPAAGAWLLDRVDDVGTDLFVALQL
jgi:hypothetical protein